MSWTPIVISLGAVVGALGRYYASLFWASRGATTFPYGTLFVNLTGALAIGFWGAAIAPLSTLPAQTHNLLVVGVLGAYTTFSTYTLEASSLLNTRPRFLGMLYWLGSPVAGLACVGLGQWLGQAMIRL
ncbi:MAG: fluoride efflux transporter CrcB [Nodosilinea sp.]